MTLIIVILVVAFIVIIIKAVKEEEIKSNDRVELLSIYEGKLKKRLKPLYVLCGVLALGILLYCFGDLHREVTVHSWLLGDISRSRWTPTHYLALFCTLIGSMGVIISFVKVSIASHYVKKYREMNDDQYEDIKEEIIQADEAAEAAAKAETANSESASPLFEPSPLCPRCGSENTRTSDDYRFKMGAKMAGSVALGAVLGNYTNFNIGQIFYAKKQYRDSIKLEKEYYCKCCGYVWREAQNNSQSEQIQTTERIPNETSSNRLISSGTIVKDSRETVPEEDSIENTIHGLRELLESKIITQKEFDKELKKLYDI